jgi:hypothetical protein
LSGTLGRKEDEMADVTIGLIPAGRNSARLIANVGTDLQVNWDLTDGQLAYLASQAVSILRNRAESRILDACEWKEKILAALDSGSRTRESGVKE